MKIFLELLLAVLLLGCKSAEPQTKQEKASSKSPAAATLKILTYNIHHGEGTDGRLDLPRIGEIIKKTGADLVALQEVDRFATRSGNVDQAAELAKLTGLHPAFGAAMPFQNGHYGQAILSRFPIQKYAVHPLPQQSGREPRIALAATIRDFVFVSTHLDHQLEPVRVSQAQRLNQILGTNTSPVILVGDFNASPTNETMRVFADWTDAGETGGQPTIPSKEPTRRIDYILLRPKESWQVRSIEVLNEPIASDHRPVLAEVRFTGK